MLEVRHDWNCAHSQDGAFIFIAIADNIIEMQAWSAIVSLCVCECVCVWCVREVYVVCVCSTYSDCHDMWILDT